MPSSVYLSKNHIYDLIFTNLQLNIITKITVKTKKQGLPPGMEYCQFVDKKCLSNAWKTFIYYTTPSKNSDNNKNNNDNNNDSDNNSNNNNNDNNSNNNNNNNTKIDKWHT